MNKKKGQQLEKLKSLIRLEETSELLQDMLDNLDAKFPSCKLIFVESSYAANIENVLGRAKIVWSKIDEFPRIPISIILDVYNLKETKLFLSLIHEFGHLKDFDNPLINIQTQRSEISAWKNAILKLDEFELINKFNLSLQKMISNCLKSYKINEMKIDELRIIDLSEINNVDIFDDKLL